jgi:hypothetical protein
MALTQSVIRLAGSALLGITTTPKVFDNGSLVVCLGHAYLHDQIVEAVDK